MSVQFRGVESLAQAAATSIVVTMPEGRVVGDLILVGLYVGGGSGTTITPPTGFTSVVGTNDGVTARQEVFRHRVTEDTADSYTFTLSASVAAVAQVVCYGGADQVTPVDVSGGQANASSASAEAPAVVTTIYNTRLVGFFGAATAAPTATPPSGFTERADTQGSAFALSVADGLGTAIGSTGTKTATLSGAAANIGTLVAVSPGQLVTVTDLRDEGGYRYEAFAPRITTELALDAVVARVLQEADRELFKRVGAAFYTENVEVDPDHTMLVAATRDLAHAGMLDILASQVLHGEGPYSRDKTDHAGSLRTQANERRRQVREWIATTRVGGRLGPHFGFRTAEGSDVIRPLFDREDGFEE